MAIHLSSAVIFVIGAFLQPTGRSAMVASNCILLIGGYSEPTDTHHLEYYHPDQDVECHQRHNLPLKLSESQYEVATSGCYLTQTQQIVLREGEKYRNKTSVYSLRDGSVKSVSAAHRPGFRQSTSASLSSSRCLSCGGFDTTWYIGKRCYEFNADKQNWTEISSLPDAVFDAASISLQGVYYVIYHHKIYAYATRTGRWMMVLGPQYYHLPSVGHAVARLSDDQMLICGGVWHSLVAVSACSVYNVTSNRVHPVNGMKWKRHSFALINFNDQIFAIGGDTRKTNRQTVEMYHKKNNSWSMAKPLKITRSAFVAFAVTLPTKTTTSTSTFSTARTPTPSKTTSSPSTNHHRRSVMTATTSRPPTTYAPTKTSTDNTNAPPKTTPSTNNQTAIAPTKISSDAENANSHREGQTPNATATTTDDGFDVRIILIILLTIGGIIFIILAVVILCVSWKKGYFSKSSKSKKPKHEPVPFDWDDEHGSKIPRDPKMKAEEKSVSQATTTDDSQMTTTTDDDMTMTMTEDERSMRSAASAAGDRVRRGRNDDSL